jgi:hypothetical protein
MSSIEQFVIRHLRLAKQSYQPSVEICCAGWGRRWDRKGCNYLNPFHTVPTNWVPSQALCTCLALGRSCCGGLALTPELAVAGVVVQAADGSLTVEAEALPLAPSGFSRCKAGIEGGLPHMR